MEEQCFIPASCVREPCFAIREMKFFTSLLQKFVTFLLLPASLVFFHIHVSLLNGSVAVCKGQHTPSRVFVFLK